MPMVRRIRNRPPMPPNSPAVTSTAPSAVASAITCRKRPRRPSPRRSSMRIIFREEKEQDMKSLVATLIMTLAVVLGVVTLANWGPAEAAPAEKPTVVLVPGAFADASSWNGVVRNLLRDGFPVIAVSNPLRSVKGDAAYVDALLATIKGPVVLVGHSYGGMVISDAATGAPNVKALV